MLMFIINIEILYTHGSFYSLLQLKQNVSLGPNTQPLTIKNTITTCQLPIANIFGKVIGGDGVDGGNEVVVRA